MTEQQVRDLIENFIVTNGVNAITANVLRPILVAILEQTNDYIGTLGNLQTVNKDSLVDAINEVIGYISSINNDGVKLYQGNLSPLVTPPAAYNTADFYYEILEQTLWQFNGVQWIRIVGNSTSINTPYKDKLFYSGSNTFTLPNNVIALDVRINGDGDNINWTQLGNSLNYSGLMTSGDFLVVIGIITNVPFTTLNNVTQRIFTVMLSDIGATDFTDDIPSKIKTYAIANGIQKLPNETHDWEVIQDFNFYLRISGTDMYDNWGIEDESTFVSYLSGQGATNIAVTDFYLSADTLRCNLSFDGATGLDLGSFGISKIINLDALVNLTYLVLNNNQLTKIENLDALINLTYLVLNSNQLTKIENLDALINLTYLVLNSNQITTIENLDSLVNLTTLELSINQLTTIENLDSLVNLTTLYLSYNQITAIENLDALINLTTLYLNSNQITTIENLDSLVNLTTLYLSSNQLTTIENLDSLVNLTTLYLNSNQITTIENLDALVNLTTLYLSYNQLTTSEFNKLNSWAILAPNNGQIYTSNNIDNFNLSTTYATLLAKGWTIYT